MDRLSDLERRVDALEKTVRGRLLLQQDRIDELKSFPLNLKPRPRGVGPRAWQIAVLLAKRGSIRRAETFSLMYGDLPESDQPTRIDTLAAHVSRLRTALKIKIESGGWASEQWQVDAKTQAKLKELTGL